MIIIILYFMYARGLNVYMRLLFNKPTIIASTRINYVRVTRRYDDNSNVLFLTKKIGNQFLPR